MTPCDTLASTGGLAMGAVLKRAVSGLLRGAPGPEGNVWSAGRVGLRFWVKDEMEEPAQGYSDCDFRTVPEVSRGVGNWSSVQDKWGLSLWVTEEFRPSAVLCPEKDSL
ncbi:hypothetical protein AAFF_G00004800 [Aldrovandia affinis]|uniref:Uncharacterized protein n=1 Tax=Aldrovandia affinis TaxID=143900 RepID=A0AAD7TDN0_9TELE|nr:hypothetical protein AAFF_G00004800 [Aldrovandia affinis]